MLDYLIVDTPPGTSDEHISLVQYLTKALNPQDGALIVSTPQEVQEVQGVQEPPPWPLARHFRPPGSQTPKLRLC